VMKRTCSIFGVNPASIGYSDMQYKTAMGEAVDSTTMFGAGQLLDWRKAIYDEVLRLLGYAHLEVRNVSLWEEDASTRADRLVKLVSSGIYTVNEARRELGLDPRTGGAVDPSVSQEQDELSEEQRALMQWQRKALKRVKEGKLAQCSFESDQIDSELSERIHRALASCADARSVRGVFFENGRD
jgi:hypothetical protein